MRKEYVRLKFEIKTDPIMGNSGKSPVEHRRKLFLKVVEGNSKSKIKKVTLDLVR